MGIFSKKSVKSKQAIEYIPPGELKISFKNGESKYITLKSIDDAKEHAINIINLISSNTNTIYEIKESHGKRIIFIRIDCVSIVEVDRYINNWEWEF